MRKLVALGTLAVIAAVGISGIAGCGSDTVAEPPSADADEPSPPKKVDTADKAQPGGPEVGMPAVEKAAAAEKYLFALFKKEDNAETAAMRTVLTGVMKDIADRANMVEVNVSWTSEQAIVDEYGLDRAPMPLILTLAPNGVVTGGFPLSVKAQELRDAFISPCMAKCMKPLQERKLVFLCVQNATTASNDEAMEGVRRFAIDPRFAAATEIVMLDPADEAEAECLADLEIDPKTATAVTVFLAPGGPVARYEGATDVDELIQSLVKA
ncbi:MAG: hypothetical protein HQ581_00310, partial [Planctomycetes bacterium]|nr:hypothetical protein [Planctomycetota bacterium]